MNAFTCSNNSSWPSYPFICGTWVSTSGSACRVIPITAPIGKSDSNGKPLPVMTFPTIYTIVPYGHLWLSHDESVVSYFTSEVRDVKPDQE